MSLRLMNIIYISRELQKDDLQLRVSLWPLEKSPWAGDDDDVIYTSLPSILPNLFYQTSEGIRHTILYFSPVG